MRPTASGPNTGVAKYSASPRPSQLPAASTSLCSSAKLHAGKRESAAGFTSSASASSCSTSDEAGVATASDARCSCALAGNGAAITDATIHKAAALHEPTARSRLRKASWLMAVTYHTWEAQRTTTRSDALRPKVSGAYISSAFAGGTTKSPGVVARTV